MREEVPQDAGVDLLSLLLHGDDAWDWWMKEMGGGVQATDSVYG